MLRNWRDECDSAALYRELAAIESNPRLQRVFGKLAESELQHAAYWQDRLVAAGRDVPRFRPSLKTRMTAALARRFGVGLVVPSITARELSDRRRYLRQQDARSAGLVQGEGGHAAIMRRIGALGEAGMEAGDGPHEASASGLIANNLRAAVLGANDGLVSNFCLLMGVAAAGLPPSEVLLTGIAGLVAGAGSMALGEWLSVTNAREMAFSQSDRQARELHSAASWKKEELALLYEAKGMDEQQARAAATAALEQDPRGLAALVEEETLLETSAAGNDPTRAAAYSFVLFALGALVPLLPFVWLTRLAQAMVASAGLALLALFVIGVMTSFFNGRSPWFSGTRQVVIGTVAAAVTYGVGHLFGTALR
jgi:vacuolar iron transporter family protein